jgi:putative phage-type endonuclease
MISLVNTPKTTPNNKTNVRSRLMIATKNVHRAHPSRSERSKQRARPRKERLGLRDRLLLKGTDLLELNERNFDHERNVMKDLNDDRFANSEIVIRYDSEERSMKMSAEEDYFGRERCVERVRRLVAADEDEDDCERSSPGQLSFEWYRKRVSMITASDVGKILGDPKETNTNSKRKEYVTAEKVFERKRELRAEYASASSSSASVVEKKVAPAINHGNSFESVALEHYAKICGERLIKFGMKTHDELVFLGASPDSLTESGKIVEVKCPFTRKIQKQTRLLEHYAQIQTTLEVFDLEVCDFVQFKPSGKGTGFSGDVSRPRMLIESVKRDREWFASNRSKLIAMAENLPPPLS